MRLNEIQLHNFRNYEDFQQEFGEGVHIVVGKNAQGKTSLLESILYLSTTRSHRTNNDADLMKDDEDSFFIKAAITKANRKENIRITVNEKGKHLFIYQNPIKRVSDFIGEFHAVMFCPDDMSLFNASPKARRRFMDMELSKMSKKYMAALYVASKLLKERNAYLKRNDLDIAYLDVLTHQLIDIQIVIIKQRYYFLKELLAKCKYFYQHLSMDNTQISIHYDSCIPFDDNENMQKQALLERYQKTLERDMYVKQTTIGVHKEDFIFGINGKEVATHASQGQKRSVLLAIKIGIIYMIETILHEYPVLLLDDVFSEIDEYRRKQLLKWLPKDVQIFISTTDVLNFEDMKKDRFVTIWNLENRKLNRY